MSGEGENRGPDFDGIEASARRLQEKVDRFRAEQKPPPPEPMSLSKAMGFAASMGFTLALSLLAGYFVGDWLDHRLHATVWVPVMLLVGLVLGPVLVYRMLKPLLG